MDEPRAQGTKIMGSSFVAFNGDARCACKIENHFGHSNILHQINERLEIDADAKTISRRPSPPLSVMISWSNASLLGFLTPMSWLFLLKVGPT